MSSETNQAHVTKDEMRAELRAFRAEIRLLFVAAVVAGPVVGNLSLTDSGKALAGAAIVAAGLLAKVLWLRT